ncbi:MAG: alpha/beta hydrolase [Solirubrobacteraceae bacterium]
MSATSTTPMVLEPGAQAFAEAVASPPFVTELGPVKGREVLDQVQSEAQAARPDARIEDFTIPGPDGEVKVRILKPAHLRDPLPVILYTHGAGWVFGGPVTHDRLVRELAAGANAAVVFPDYMRSPEAKYPQANEEAYAVAEWIKSQGQEKGLDTSRVVVVGDSCGGNMAAALAIMAKQRGGPKFLAQALLYPVTDAEFDNDSYREFGEGYHLRRDMMEWFWDQYTQDPAERELITVSPLKATLDDLRGLPPALVINGEAEVLRDEGEAYARKLRAAGVDVEASRHGGMIHDFMMLDATRNDHGAQAATAETIEFIRRHLGT